MNEYIREFISNAVADGKAHGILCQREEVDNYLLRTGKCTIGYDSALALIRVSGLSPDEQREAKLVVEKELQNLHF